MEEAPSAWFALVGARHHLVQDLGFLVVLQMALAVAVAFLGASYEERNL